MTHTHECEKCGRSVGAPPDAPDRIETITACDKGDTCTYVRIKPAAT